MKNPTYPGASPDFYSINDGNQFEFLFTIDYNIEWFEEVNKKYSWEQFEVYHNKYYAFYHHFFDPIFDQIKGKKMQETDLFYRLTKGQKVVWTFNIFNAQTDNGGVYQFFFNRPKFCIAALETFEELELEQLAEDYDKCLEEMLSIGKRFGKRKNRFNKEGLDWEQHWASFAEGYGDVPSAEIIEAYYYKEPFKKTLYKAVADYIELNLDMFVKR